MSSRRRLTRPTAFVAAVLVVLGVSGGASALGAPVLSAQTSREVEVTPVQGGVVTLCVRGTCQKTPQPLAQGAKLTVTAASNEGATPPGLAVDQNPIECQGQFGVAIVVATANATAFVSANVVGEGAASAEPVDPISASFDQLPQTSERIVACVEPVSL